MHHALGRMVHLTVDGMTGEVGVAFGKGER